MATTLIRDIDILVTDIDEEPLYGANLVLEGNAVQGVDTDTAVVVAPHDVLQLGRPLGARPCSSFPGRRLFLSHVEWLL